MRLTFAVVLVSAFLAPARSDQRVAAPVAAGTNFIERLGRLEFSGRMIVRPLQPEVLRGCGFDETQLAEHRKRIEQLVDGLVIEHFADVDEFVVRLPAGEDENQFAARLMATADIEYAEPDWICHPVLTPNDPEFPIQWHHAKLQSALAWNTSTGSSAIICAFTDTGFDLTHPDLAGKFVPGFNAVSNLTQEEGGDVTDVAGHGTAVAGTACAIGNNARGVAGIGWNQRIMPVRVTDLSSGNASQSDILQGARWAASHGAKVVSSSYSGVESAAVQTSGAFINSRGALYCYAAGNDSSNWSYFDHLNVIVVGASDSADQRAWFSGYGRAVDVFAPGVDIGTTLSGGGYGYVSGTSFSTPMTNGVLSMIWSINPALEPATVELLMRLGCDDLGAAGEDDTFGFGRVNLRRAVELASQSLSPASPTAVADAVLAFTDVPKSIDALANDYDINGDWLVIDSVDPLSTAGGSVVIVPGAGPIGRDLLQYISPPGFTGSDGFAYVARDTTGRTSSGVVSLVIDDLDTYRPADTPTFYAQALDAAYYDLPAGTASLPNFAALAPYRRSYAGWLNYPSTDGEFMDTNRSDNVAAVFTGYVLVPEDSRYTFFTDSDDGSRLFIGEQLVVDNDGLHGMQERSGEIGLRAGFQSVRVEFFERTGGAGLQVRIAGGPLLKQVVSSTRWFRKTCPADFNADGTVGLSDLSLLLGNFGTTGRTRFEGDLNADTDVDLSDLSLLLATFGDSCP